MKKLFICALALASVVACSKDDAAQGPALESLNKSIQIKIENASATRATDGQGVNAGNTAATNGTSQSSVVNAGDLKILFANSSGVILKELPLVGTAEDHVEAGPDLPAYSYGSFTATGDAADHEKNGVYVFHNVPAAVTQVAVVRYEAKDIDGGNVVEGSTNLTDVEEAATNPALNLQRELEDIVLYGDSDLIKADPAQAEVVVGGITYYVYNASVTVAPAFARLEIDQIHCTDLGYKNDDNDPATVDFDELTLNTFTWSSYAIAPAELTTLKGQYVSGQANATVEDENLRIAKPQTGVWSWNIPEQKFSKMTLNMTADAYDYDVADSDVNLYITDLAVAEDDTTSKWDGTYKATHIYKLSIPFSQSNLADQEGICANVTVEIVPWTVNTVTPVFGTK